MDISRGHPCRLDCLSTVRRGGIVSQPTAPSYFSAAVFFAILPPMYRILTCLCALSMAQAGLAVAAAPATRDAPAARPRPSASAELPSRLGDLLRQLDYDQSRKLTRQIEPAQSVFVGSDLAAAVATVQSTSAPAVLVVGRRGPLSDSPVEIEQTFEIPAGGLQQTLRGLEPKMRARSAYLSRVAPDGGWSSSLSSTDHGESADPHRLSEALSAPGSAAFLFVMQQNSVQKIILIPDTVKVTVSGTGSAPPPQSRSMPTRAEMHRAYPVPEPPDFAMPEPPPMPEPVEPPSDDSGE